MAPFGLLLFAALPTQIPQTGQDTILPPGVKVVWDLAKAERSSTSTRESICLNGLWRWQPVKGDSIIYPHNQWGYFKVPGSWPGTTDYLQKDCQTLFANPAWKNVKISEVTSAWYQREFSIPATWKNRKIFLKTNYLNSHAKIYVDGNTMGQMRFPSGMVDITTACKPGVHHLLSLQVTALPLNAVMQSFTDTNSSRTVEGKVQRRGLCGDVYLSSEPAAEKITATNIITSYQLKQIQFDATMDQLEPSRTYQMSVEINSGANLAKTFVSPFFNSKDLANGKFTFVGSWLPNKLWDMHTPQNQFTYCMKLAKIDPDGANLKICDITHSTHFGFREFWISGKDFYLNGTRLYLSILPFDNALCGAKWASYEGAKETFLRLQSIGINFVYAHNYDCEPGAHLSFSEILRAADDVGMLVALSQPHFSSYKWDAPDADRNNGYRDHAAFYANVAGSHPSVVAYSMSHNATSYDEAKNPFKIDSNEVNRDSWSMNNVRKALRAEAIVKSLDASRIVYHHSSGNLGSMYTENFYVNFAPIQELSDWFKHWSETGTKPLFLCEYGVPFSWDWAMYRGWFKGQREWGSANVPWEFCMAEWNAQFLGDSAYKISESEKRDLRWEAEQFKTKVGWHRWDYPVPMGSTRFSEINPILSQYIQDNWRSYRSLGVSATSPWEYEILFQKRDNIARQRKNLNVDWDHLQRPGYSPDYVEDQPEQMALSHDREDWSPTSAGQVLIDNNAPILAFLAGKSQYFTSKDHLFKGGETVEKQAILINNSRIPETMAVSCECNVKGFRWKEQTITIKPGDQIRLPIVFNLPDENSENTFELRLRVRLSNGKQISDAFMIHSVPSIKSNIGKIYLFDPLGETKKEFDRLRIPYQLITATDKIQTDTLVIGKHCVGLSTPLPDVSAVRSGLKVVVFEQTAVALEQRLGFRIAEYGLRNVYTRTAFDFGVRNIDSYLNNWRGASTNNPPKLEYSLKPMYGPMVKWCGLDVPHVWRSSNQGNVASVLIEKPATGNFLPILEGGFSLQYSPLLRYFEGKGNITFCQLDVTGRTEVEPVADNIVRSLLNSRTSINAMEEVTAYYLGEAKGKEHFERSGMQFGNLQNNSNTDVAQLILGGQLTDQDLRQAKNWVERGGKMLCVGTSAGQWNSIFANPPKTKNAEHISTYFSAISLHDFGMGVSPADLHNRAPQNFDLIAENAHVIGDGILARSLDQKVDFFQIAPWNFNNGSFGEPGAQFNLKRTFRRISFAASRLAANLGIKMKTPLLANFNKPSRGIEDKRWLSGLYLDTPEIWDDPYRFFPW